MITATTARMMRFSIVLLPFAQCILRRKLFVGIPYQRNHDSSQNDHHNQTRQESGTERAGGNQRANLIGKIGYDLTLREGANEKELIDQLRCRNGNLEIMLSMQG